MLASTSQTPASHLAMNPAVSLGKRVYEPSHAFSPSILTESQGSTAVSCGFGLLLMTADNSPRLNAHSSSRSPIYLAEIHAATSHSTVSFYGWPRVGFCGITAVFRDVNVDLMQH